MENKLLHIAAIHPKNYLILKQNDETAFQWYQLNKSNQLKATDVIAPSLPHAIRSGYKKWEDFFFRLIHCGFRYTLPERDQVGSNALFWQMALSYNTPNGRYFDEELGHLCYVDFASQEALEIWRNLLGKQLETITT